MFCSDRVVDLSPEFGALCPVPAHQHVLLQRHRQTVSHSVIHELQSVRRQRGALAQRQVCRCNRNTTTGRIKPSPHTAESLFLCSSSTTLKLDGVKRVWGRDGYLVQTEPVQEAAQVETPSQVQSPLQQGDEDRSHSQTPTPTPTPESEQEKQQLASSLFVGLASPSSVCLVSS